MRSEACDEGTKHALREVPVSKAYKESLQDKVRRICKTRSGGEDLQVHSCEPGENEGNHVVFFYHEEAQAGSFQGGFNKAEPAGVRT